MKEGGNSMFKVLGIKFKFNLLFVLVLFLFSISGLFMTASLSFLVVILHELAHSLIAKREGVLVKEIEVLPFGGVAKFRDLIQLKPENELKIALAGPLLNLILAAIALILVRYGIIAEEAGNFFLKINLSIALFNLIPALPLDGGRILRAYLTSRIGFKDATYYSMRVSKVLSIILAILSVIFLYFGYTNIILLLISFFIYFVALKEGKYASYVLMQYIAKKKGRILKEQIVPIKQLLANEDTPLGEIIDKLVPNQFHMVTVVNDEFEIRGVITEDKFINSLISEGIEEPIKNLLK